MTDWLVHIVSPKAAPTDTTISSNTAEYWRTVRPSTDSGQVIYDTPDLFIRVNLITEGDIVIFRRET